MAKTFPWSCTLITLLCLTHLVSSCPSPCSCTRHIVNCRGQGLLNIPDSIPDDTELLDLSDNRISTINNNSFSSLSELRTLNISNNQIDVISPRAFLGLYNLQVLDLDRNQIEHFVKGNLSSLSNLQTLSLNWNRILDLECDAINLLQNLTDLHVHHNKITVFPDKCFERLDKLLSFDLSWNRLHLICEHTFLGLTSLQSLLLNDNHLHHAISDNAFKPLARLDFLDLSNAHVFGLTNKTFTGLISLSKLNLSNNAIEDICSGAFGPLVNVEDLDLSKNPIVVIPDNGFSRSIKLKWLKVAQMPELVFFYPKAFSGLSNLLHLEAYENPRMEVLHRDLLVPLKRIQTIDFRNGGIMSVHSSVVRNITSHPQLMLSGNPLKCSCALTWMKLPTHKSNATVDIVDLETLMCASPDNLSGMKLLDVPTANLTCAKAKILNHTEVVEYQIATSVELECKVEGEPRPSITWVTPNKKNFTFVPYDPYVYWPSEVVLTEHVKNGSYHANHLWHGSTKYHTTFGDSQRIHLLDNGNLYIDYVVRGDAGPYSCIAVNSGGNDSTIIRLHLDYFVIRQVRDFTCFIGGMCSAGVFVISVAFASIRALVEKCSQACCKKKRKERKGLREILDNIGTYKTERMQTLRDNYHIHVDKIKDQCSQNLLRLRENYHTQIGKIRDNCACKIERVRTNYANQKGKIKGFGSHKVEQIRDNYNSQVLKIRDYGHNQLKKIHENYKVQQQHILKILELLNIDNCKGVVDAECLRSESMLFDAQLLVDPMETPEAVTPDNRSESDYMTAGSNSEVCSLNEQIEGAYETTLSHTVVNEAIGDTNVAFEREESVAEPLFFVGNGGDLEQGEVVNKETTI